MCYIISLKLEIVEFEHVIKITNNNILIYGKDKLFFYTLSYLLKDYGLLIDFNIPLIWYLLMLRLINYKLNYRLNFIFPTIRWLNL